MDTITLKKLHTEGRLSIGDTLHHSRLGDCRLFAVVGESKLRVIDCDGTHHTLTVDFGPGARIVPIAPRLGVLK